MSTRTSGSIKQSALVGLGSLSFSAGEFSLGNEFLSSSAGVVERSFPC